VSNTAPDENSAGEGRWSGPAICALLDDFGLSRSLGIRLSEVTPGAACSEMTVGQEHASFPATGQTHGGAILTLIDHTAGAAVAGAMLLDPPLAIRENAGFDRVVAVEVNANFIRLPHAGDLVRARAEVIHHGRTVLVIETSVTDERTRLVARGRQTCLIRAPELVDGS
jgi:uncharacterized protein (TIGR00369 family)